MNSLLIVDSKLGIKPKQSDHLLIIMRQCAEVWAVAESLAVPLHQSNVFSSTSVPESIIVLVEKPMRNRKAVLQQKAT